MGRMAFLLAAMNLVATSAVAVDKLYWTDSGASRIQRANLDGTGVEEVLTGLGDIRAISADSKSGIIYWSEFSPSYAIWQAALNTGVVSSFVAPGNSTTSIALAESESRIYWGNASGIERSLMDGSNRGKILFGEVLGIALDLDNRKIYFTYRGGVFPSIRRANLDGSEMELQVTGGLSNPWAIALDVPAGRMYWSEADQGTIRSANLDGDGIQTVISPGGRLSYHALAIHDGRIYWATQGPGGTIGRANLDGSNVETIVSTGLIGPQGLAILTDSSTPPTETASIKLTPEVVGITVTEEASLRVLLTSTCDASGFSFGISHDSAVLRPVSVEPSGATAALRAGQGPEYWFADLDSTATGCAAASVGIVAAMVGSLSDPANQTIPAGSDREIATVVYEAAANAVGNGESALKFVNCLQANATSEPVRTVVTCGGLAINPSRSSASVHITGVRFRRGEVNGDGSFDIGDPVALLFHLFAMDRLQVSLECLDAADCDDDGVLNVTDVLCQLARLFRGSPPLPAPYGLCGTDPTPSGLGCSAYIICQ